jgi:DNA-binding transcriptional LysR family regulator
MMALDGRGMAWLPLTLIRDELASGRLVEAAQQDWTIELEIRLYRDRAPLGKAAEDFQSAVHRAPT